MVGEALIGFGPDIAHIDLVIGPRGGPVEIAFMSSLAMPRQGHTSLLATLDPVSNQSLRLCSQIKLR